jgi:hypothetical protein
MKLVKVDHQIFVLDLDQNDIESLDLIDEDDGFTLKVYQLEQHLINLVVNLMNLLLEHELYGLFRPHFIRFFMWLLIEFWGKLKIC